MISCDDKRPDVIENPRFDSNSSSILKIEKIELADSASIFHFRGRGFQDNTFSIGKGVYIRSNGQPLFLKSADGLTMGEQVTGEHKFTLTFPAIASDVTKIDFIEGENANIYGIDLTKRKKFKKIIKNPAIDVHTGYIIEIQQVDMTDTATVLHMNAFFNPGNWMNVGNIISLQVEEDSSKFFINDMEGLEFSQQFTFPESGEHSFKMLFPAIPEKTKKINLVFGADDSFFNILGVELKSNTVKNGLKLPAEYASVHKKYKDEKLENPVFKNGTAILSGQVLGFRPEFNVKITAYYDNIITGNQDDHLLETDDAGFFKVEIPMECRSQVLFRIEVRNNIILNNYIVLTPDEESKVCINLQDYAKKGARFRYDKGETIPFLYFAGANASLNNQFYIHDLTKIRSKYVYASLDRYDTIAYMSAPAYKEYVYSKMNEALNEVSKFKTSKEIKRFFEGHIRYMFSSYLFHPGIDYAYQTVKNLSRGDEFGDDYIVPVLDSAYYSFMSDLPLNDPISLIYGQNYPINASTFIRYFGSGREGSIVVPTRFLEKLLNNNLIDAEDTTFVREIVLSDSKYISDEKFDSFKTMVRDFLNDLKKNPKATPEVIKLIDKEFAKINHYQKDDIQNIVFLDIYLKIARQIGRASCRERV